MGFLDLLNEWTDWDVAAFLLASSLGLLSLPMNVNLENQENHEFFTHFARHKYLFHTDTALGQFTHELLTALVQLGALLTRDEPDTQYKRNPLGIHKLLDL